MFKFDSYLSSNGDLQNRINEIVNTNKREEVLSDLKKTILGLIDLTTLSGTDNTSNVRALCTQGLSYLNKEKGIPNVAAICVYPVFAKLVSGCLENSDLKTACVAGAFPSGQSPLNLRLAEVEYCISEGANEIDMVISRGKLLEGDYDFVFDEIKEIKSVCGDVHLKVILETGELKEVSLIRRASEIAILAGADFLKTSTGKISPAATLEAFIIMLDTIKEYYDKTGTMIGIKAAGGISSFEEAIKYYISVEKILGDKWLNKNYFRIGASRLADNVYNAITI